MSLSPVPHDPRPGAPAPLVAELGATAERIDHYRRARAWVLARYAITGELELVRQAAELRALLAEWELV